MAYVPLFVTTFPVFIFYCYLNHFSMFLKVAIKLRAVCCQDTPNIEYEFKPNDFVMQVFVRNHTLRSDVVFQKKLSFLIENVSNGNTSVCVK